MIEKYDLVRVKKFENKDFINGVGIITKVYDDNLYKLIFIGKRLNKLSDRMGGILFSHLELEVI